ncbi:hypothetical protein PWT90_03810 [Aphanocladium album]|nr:hypothetical protein PWT90_03810 [Aphanocladium album]
MSLLKIPSELIFCIARFLKTEKDISCFTRTCRRLYSTLNVVLYERNRVQGNNSALVWAIRRDVPQILRHAREAGTILAEEGLHLVHFAAQYGREHLVSVLVGEFGFGHSNLDDEDTTPLLVASENGKSRVVEVLLQLGADPSQPAYFGQTPLHAAAYANELEIAAILLSAGADSSSRTEEHCAGFPGQTPLHMAIDNRGSRARGSRAMAELLVKHGADINAQCADGLTPLHWAIDCCNDQEVIRYLVSAGADLSIATADQRTMLPLHYAVEAGQLDVVALLLNHGAEVNTQSGEGWAPIEYAVQQGLLEITALLLKNGADVHGSQSDGWKLIATAVEDGHGDIVKLLLDAGADVHDSSSDIPLLAQACHSGHGNLVPILLEHGADANFVDDQGNSVMNLAVAGGHTAVVAMLLQNTGVDPSLGDNNGLTPLHLAADGGHLDIAKLLVESGVDVSKLDRNRNTPLHYAAKAGHADAVKLLLGVGVDPSVPNVNQNTPLLTAAGHGHADIVGLLLEQKADPCYADDGQRTPLLLASWIGHRETMKLLLGHPTAAAQISMADKDGYTPLLAASSSNHLEAVQLLLEKGADVEDLNCTGAGPLIIAAEQGDAEMVNALLATRKVNVDHQDVNGRTALFTATMFGRDAAVDALISHKPKPKSNLQDRYGATPLIMAARTCRSKILESLLRLDDVPLPAKDIFARDVFYWGARSVNPDVISLLAPFDQSGSMEIDVDDDFEEPGSRGDACCCDVCGRYTTGASATHPPAYSCRICHVGHEEEFICCHYCVEDGAKCRDLSHVWEPHNCKCDEAEEGEDDGDDAAADDA